MRVTSRPNSEGSYNSRRNFSREAASSWLIMYADASVSAPPKPSISWYVREGSSTMASFDDAAAGCHFRAGSSANLFVSAVCRTAMAPAGCAQAGTVWDSAAAPTVVKPKKPRRLIPSGMIRPSFPYLLAFHTRAGLVAWVAYLYRTLTALLRFGSEARRA